MVTALSESELAELRESASISQMSARRLLSDLAHEREARREGERLLREPYITWDDWDIASLKVKVSEQDWIDHRDAFLASASPKAGGNEKPDEDVK